MFCVNSNELENTICIVAIIIAIWSFGLYKYPRAVGLPHFLYNSASSLCELQIDIIIKYHIPIPQATINSIEKINKVIINGLFIFERLT